MPKTDIVERMRRHARVADGWTRPDAAEAADEIERLRAEVSDILAENDALRLALNNTSLHVAAARREGIEAAALAAANYQLNNDGCVAAIRALLEDGR